MHRRQHEEDSHGLAATVAVAGGLGSVVAVRWLVTQDWMVQAGLAAGVVIVLAGLRAVLPRRRVPRHRVRHMRIRARLRLHPGPGHATAFELWLRWGRLAAARRARRSRPSLPWWARVACPSEVSVLVGRAHYGHALRVPVEEHVIYIAPPRSGKTGAVADVLARHPGPAVVTTTRGDLYELTAGIRAARGPVHVFSPQQLADIPSTMRWDILDGCEDPATAIRRALPLAAIASFKGEGEDYGPTSPQSASLQGVARSASWTSTQPTPRPRAGMVRARRAPPTGGTPSSRRNDERGSQP